MAKILVVEDDLIIQNLMLFYLQDKQHQVLVAANGRDGISLAREEQPDLIIMDLRLPVLDGWQATEQLKTSPQTAGIPVLAMTAQSYTAVRERFHDTGCDGYVGKPINFPDLFTQIDSLTRGKISA
ncbi:MAG: response regulator [Anaerolineae bacterium]|nr:response regulator [Anaerolineae bacterium]